MGAKRFENMKDFYDYYISKDLVKNDIPEESHDRENIDGRLDNNKIKDNIDDNNIEDGLDDNNIDTNQEDNNIKTNSKELNFIDELIKLNIKI